jgi:hypothetical protein
MEGGKCNQHTENAPFIVSEMEDRHMSKHWRILNAGDHCTTRRIISNTPHRSHSEFFRVTGDYVW